MTDGGSPFWLQKAEGNKVERDKSQNEGNYWSFCAPCNQRFTCENSFYDHLMTCSRVEEASKEVYQSQPAPWPDAQQHSQSDRSNREQTSVAPDWKGQNENLDKVANGGSGHHVATGSQKDFSYCDLCNLKFRGKQSYEMHTKGMLHNNKLAENKAKKNSNTHASASTDSVASISKNGKYDKETSSRVERPPHSGTSTSASISMVPTSAMRADRNVMAHTTNTSRSCSTHALGMVHQSIDKEAKSQSMSNNPKSILKNSSTTPIVNTSSCHIPAPTQANSKASIAQLSEFNIDPNLLATVAQTSESTIAKVKEMLQRVDMKKAIPNKRNFAADKQYAQGLSACSAETTQGDQTAPVKEALLEKAVHDSGDNTPLMKREASMTPQPNTSNDDMLMTQARRPMFREWHEAHYQLRDLAAPVKEALLEKAVHDSRDNTPLMEREASRTPQPNTSNDDMLMTQARRPMFREWHETHYQHRSPFPHVQARHPSESAWTSPGLSYRERKVVDYCHGNDGQPLAKRIRVPTSAQPTFNAYDRGYGRRMDEHAQRQMFTREWPNEWQSPIQPEPNYRDRTWSEVHERELEGGARAQQPAVPDPSRIPAMNSPVDDTLYCKICDITCLSKGNYRDHILGHKHKKKLRQYGILPAEEKRANTEDGLLYSIPTSEPRIQPAIDKCHEPLIGLDYVSEHHFVSCARVHVYFCDLCDSRMDPRLLMSHITGMKHRRKYMKYHHKESWEKLIAAIAEGQEPASILVFRSAQSVEELEGRFSIRLRVEIPDLWKARSRGYIDEACLYYWKDGTCWEEKQLRWSRVRPLSELPGLHAEDDTDDVTNVTVKQGQKDETRHESDAGKYAKSSKPDGDSKGMSSVDHDMISSALKNMPSEELDSMIRAMNKEKSWSSGGGPSHTVSRQKAQESSWEPASAVTGQTNQKKAEKIMAGMKGGSSENLFQSLMECMVDSDTDAAMALQVSNSLTKSLLEYRLKKLVADHKEGEDEKGFRAKVDKLKAQIALLAKDK